MRGPAPYLAVALALLLLTPACSPEEAAPAEQGGDRLKVLVHPYLGYAQFFIAREEGYFADQGLDVEFVEGASSARALPLFVQGRVDVFAGLLSAGIINAVGQGAPIRLVAEKGHVGTDRDPYICMMARPDLVESGRLKTASDLKGLTVIRDPTSTMCYFVDSILATGGLSEDDVEFRYLQMPIRGEALSNGAYLGFSFRAAELMQ